jgi:hypothetical protein
MHGVDRYFSVLKSNREPGRNWRRCLTRSQQDRLGAEDRVTAQKGEFGAVYGMGEFLVTLRLEVSGRSPSGFLQKNEVRFRMLFKRLEALIHVLATIVGEHCQRLPGGGRTREWCPAGSEIQSEKKIENRSYDESRGGPAVPQQCGEKEQGTWYQKCGSRKIEQERESEILFPDPAKRYDEQQQDHSVSEHAYPDTSADPSGDPLLQFASTRIVGETLPEAFEQTIDTPGRGRIGIFGGRHFSEAE